MFIDVNHQKKFYPCSNRCDKLISCPAKAPTGKVYKGYHVKVNVHGWEKFWVYITKVEGNKITGTVNNDMDLWYLHGLRYGDTIQFERRHIWDYKTPSEI